MDGRPTLMDWMRAHRALLAEETKLMCVAADVASSQCDVRVLQEQQERLVVCRESADAVYAAVMEELSRSE